MATSKETKARASKDPEKCDHQSQGLKGDQKVCNDCGTALGPV